MGRFWWTARAFACALAAALGSAAVGGTAAAEATGPPAPGLVQTQRSAWRWIEPGPQGESLFAISSSGGGTYAVGEHGTVLYSGDGGVDWAADPSGTEAALSLVQSLGQGTVVVGGGCTLREQQGAGVFRRLAVDASESSCAQKIASFSFLDANTGWVELSDGSVLLTTDGGATFQAKARVPLGGGTVGELRFVSPGLGFALVNHPGGAAVIVRTTDGGSSWQQVASAPAGEPLDDLSFPAPGAFYAIGGGASINGVSESVVLVSEDAGASWSRRVQKGGVISPELRRVACSTPLSCVFVGAFGAGNQVLESEDGGVTLTASSPLSAGQLIAVAWDGLGSTAVVGDGGASLVRGPTGGWGPARFSREAGNYSGAFRLGLEATAYRVGAAGQIEVVHGSEAAALQLPTSATLADVAFPTKADGYAAGTDGTLYRTGNGGQTWAILGGGGETPASLLAPSAATVLLIGPTGIRRSTDSGQSFTAVSGTVVVSRRHGRPVRRALSRFPLFAGSESVGSASIAWGDQAIESTDGGAHWTLIPSPLATGNVEALSFVTPSRGYEVSRQRLFFTADRGRHWREIGSLGTEALGGEGHLSFSSAADGYVVGRVGGSRDFVLHTLDGGRTWLPEQLPREVLAVSAAGGAGGDFIAGSGSSFEGGEGRAGGSISLMLSGGHTIGAAQLRRAHGRVKLRGRLKRAGGSPLAGETAIVSWRARGRSVWRHRAVTLDSSGAFAVTIGGIASSTDFVAQWAGDGPAGGAGTAAQGLTVTRR